MGMRGIFGKARAGAKAKRPKPDTFLGRLARDVRGNTLAIMGAALIPFCGLVGGGMDVARMYITKTRLQHACDAGALAGRKQMGAGTWGTDDNAAAVQFFNANFDTTGMYGGNAPTVAFTENAGKVSGNASATLPMTLMKVLGKTSETLAVTCDAEMRLPNTDVMFVLDTTGSMGDVPLGDTRTKLASLKSAVKCFYEIVARLDTDEACTTGTPSGGTGNQVQVRFGFMPYAVNVNVGHLLPPAYFADNWPYQSREAQWTTATTTSYPNPAVDTPGSPGSGTEPWSGWSTYSSSFLFCQAQPANQNNVTGTASFDSAVTTNAAGVKTWTTRTYTKYNVEYQSPVYVGWNCTVQKRTAASGSYTTVVHTQSPVTATTQTFNRWKYGRITQPIAGLKNGNAWNASFQLPIGDNGAMKTITWDGCIEERPTVRQSSYDPIPSDAKDLDIDLTPDPAIANTLWGPAIRDMIYTPSDAAGNWVYTGSLSDSNPEVYSTGNFNNDSYYQCPTEARKLQAWTDPGPFDTYVDSLTSSGNTYHDIGLLWGARFLSPDGIFKSENATTPQGGDIERNMIFMTDGDACTGVNNYTAYGVNWFDRRETSESVAPTDGCTTNGTLTAQVNARTAALCTAIKNKNITLWVITFGTLDPSTVTRMTECATTGRYFNATNAATIQSTFQTIANQISQLRLTK